MVSTAFCRVIIWRGIYTNSFSLSHTCYTTRHDEDLRKPNWSINPQQLQDGGPKILPSRSKDFRVPSGHKILAFSLHKFMRTVIINQPFIHILIKFFNWLSNLTSIRTFRLQNFTKITKSIMEKTVTSFPVIHQSVTSAFKWFLSIYIVQNHPDNPQWSLTAWGWCN